MKLVMPLYCYPAMHCSNRGCLKLHNTYKRAPADEKRTNLQVFSVTATMRLKTSIIQHARSASDVCSTHSAVLTQPLSQAKPLLCPEFRRTRTHKDNRLKVAGCGGGGGIHHRNGSIAGHSLREASFCQSTSAASTYDEEGTVRSA